MLQEQPSRTLLRTALRKAQHQLLDDPCILHDPVIGKLVAKAPGELPLATLDNDQTPHPALLRGLFAFRSRFTEDRLREASTRGVRQYVILGAGLDTFPWRQPAFAREMSIFAVDHPASLAWTQARCHARGFPSPPNLIRAPVDLERGGLMCSLLAHGFELGKTSFCSALGVVPYLSQAAIDAVLRFAASLARDSEIVFSFNPPNDELDGADLEMATYSVELTAALGEPWLSRPRTRDLVNQLATLGFRDIFHLSPELAQARYFAGRNDDLRAPRWEQLVAAIV